MIRNEKIVIRHKGCLLSAVPNGDRSSACVRVLFRLGKWMRTMRTGDIPMFSTQPTEFAAVCFVVRAWIVWVVFDV